VGKRKRGRRSEDSTCTGVVAMLGMKNARVVGDERVRRRR